MKKILVLGARGLLGRWLWLRFKEQPGWEVHGTTCDPPFENLSRLDLGDAQSIQAIFQEYMPDVAILAAANPHVDYCEEHPDETRRVNVVGSLAVLEAALSCKSKAIFFSSDYVFDGKKGVYTEEDKTNPLSEYGRQKLGVEHAFLDSNSRSLVIRVSGMYGWQLKPKNLALQVLARTQKGQPMELAADQKYKPTYVEDVAEAVCQLVEKDLNGLYHVAGSEEESRYGFACDVAEAFGCDKSLLTPEKFENIPYGAKRPQRSILITEKLERNTGMSLLGVREGLEKMKGRRSYWQSLQ